VLNLDELNSVKMSSGGARKDMSGFTMDFSTQEEDRWFFLPTGSTAYNNAVMITPANVIIPHFK
jgi:hypothetical protein